MGGHQAQRAQTTYAINPTAPSSWLPEGWPYTIFGCRNFLLSHRKSPPSQEITWAGPAAVKRRIRRAPAQPPGPPLGPGSRRPPAAPDRLRRAWLRWCRRHRAAGTPVRCPRRRGRLPLAYSERHFEPGRDESGPTDPAPGERISAPGPTATSSAHSRTGASPRGPTPRPGRLPGAVGTPPTREWGPPTGVLATRGRAGRPGPLAPGGAPAPGAGLADRHLCTARLPQQGGPGRARRPRSARSGGCLAADRSVARWPPLHVGRSYTNGCRLAGSQRSAAARRDQVPR